jgi:hypothetical protein
VASVALTSSELYNVLGEGDRLQHAGEPQGCGITQFENGGKRIMPEPATEVEIPREWQEEFEAAARRPLAVRWNYGLVKTYKPVLDDAPYRSFESMEEYRQWCEANLPEWLGYGRV